MAAVKGKSEEVEQQEEEAVAPVTITVLRQRWAEARFRIEGTAPVLTQRPAGLKAEMRARKLGKKSAIKARPIWKPQEEFEGHMHRTKDGRLGFPAIALKKAMISGAQRSDPSLIKQTPAMRGAFYIYGEPHEDPSFGDVVPFLSTNGGPVMDEALVKNSGGKAPDLRVRPRWDEWAAEVRVRYSSMFDLPTLANMLANAGESVGICSRRLERSGERFGLFEVVATKETEA